MEIRETCRARMLDYLNMFQNVQYELMAAGGELGASVYTGDMLSIIVDDNNGNSLCSCNIVAELGDEENDRRFKEFEKRLNNVLTASSDETEN